MRVSVAEQRGLCAWYSDPRYGPWYSEYTMCAWYSGSITTDRVTLFGLNECPDQVKYLGSPAEGSGNGCASIPDRKIKLKRN